MPADPFARSVFIRSLYSRSLPSKRHANAHTLGGGDQGTQRRGPRGGRGRRTGGRALRARTGGRALRARGPFGPLGPSGAQGGRLYATKAMPNGIVIRGESISVWNPYKRKKMYGKSNNNKLEYARCTHVTLIRIPRGAPRYIFGQLFEPGQRPAGQAGDLRVMNPTNVINFICMESRALRTARLEG